MSKEITRTEKVMGAYEYQEQYNVSDVPSEERTIVEVNTLGLGSRLSHALRGILYEGKLYVSTEALGISPYRSDEGPYSDAMDDGEVILSYEIAEGKYATFVGIDWARANYPGNEFVYEVIQEKASVILLMRKEEEQYTNTTQHENGTI